MAAVKLISDDEPKGFESQPNAVALLKKAQSVETERRDKVTEVHDFLDEPDGQWDDKAVKAFK